MAVEYARQGDLFVAYASRGEGPHTIVVVSNWMTDVESLVDVPQFRALGAR